MTGPVRWLALLGAATCLLLAAAAPAAAHATLEETSPAADALLRTAPERVELRFSEAVDAGLGGVTVFGPDGSRVDRGTSEVGDGGATVTVRIDTTARGTYTVAWSVISEDAHNISGSFVFSVGQETGAADLPSSDRPAVDMFAGVARWLAFAGTIMLVGALAYLLAIASAGGPRSLHGGLLALLRLGALATVVGTTAALVAQIAVASGRPLIDSLGLLPDTAVNTRFGVLGLVRAVLAAAALGLTRLATRQLGQFALGGIAGGLLVVPALAGHAWTASPRLAAVASDAIHLGAASVWIGGLAALLAHAPGSPNASRLAARFSTLALAAVVTVAITGSVSAYLQVGSLDALTSTAYGQILIAKVLLVGALVALGWVNRRRLVGLLPARATLFSVARVELGIAAAVVALTAALVVQPPARDAISRPFEAVVETRGDPEGGQLQVEVLPGRVGTNEIHLYFLDAAGLPRPVDAAEMTVGRAGVPARRVTVTPLTADHASAYGVSLPSPATWTLNVTAVREGRRFTASVRVPIR